jgi:ABC-type dipeptide/oligopeptide/nickel transport system permease subunit
MPTRKHALRTIPWIAFFAGLALAVLLIMLRHVLPNAMGPSSFSP